MSMRLNRFGMLQDISRKIKKCTESGQRFNKFKLTAVVLHDPDDMEFKDYFRNRYDEFSESTGEHFLFMTFISLPPQKRLHEVECDYTSPKYMVADKSLKPESEDTICNALKRNFGITERGNFLIITESLASRDFFYVPTSVNDLERQFRILTDYCNKEADGESHSPAEYQRLKDDLGKERTITASTFIELLQDFASLVNKPEIGFRGYDNGQREHAIEYIKKVKSTFGISEDNDTDEKIMALYDCIAIACNNGLFRERGSREREPVEHDECDDDRRFRRWLGHMLDRKSRKWLNTYKILAERFPFDYDGVDYSALSLYLAKIIENELNLSLLQEIRRFYQIPMPRYFNRNCSPMGNITVPAGNRHVQINYANDHQAPILPLGELYHAYRDYVKKNNLQDDFGHVFFGIWDEIYKNRNLAAHPQEYQEDQYCKMMDNYRWMEQYAFEKLFSIKRELSVPENSRKARLSNNRYCRNYKMKIK